MWVNSNDIEMRVGCVDFIELEPSQTLLFKRLLVSHADKGGQAKCKDHTEEESVGDEEEPRQCDK